MSLEGVVLLLGKGLGLAKNIGVEHSFLCVSIGLVACKFKVLFERCAMLEQCVKVFFADDDGDYAARYVELGILLHE